MGLHQNRIISSLYYRDLSFEKKVSNSELYKYYQSKNAV